MVRQTLTACRGYKQAVSQIINTAVKGLDTRFFVHSRNGAFNRAVCIDTSIALCMQEPESLHSVPVVRVFVLCNSNKDFTSVFLFNYTITPHALRTNDGVVVVNGWLLSTLKLARIGVPINDPFLANTFQHIPQLETGKRCSPQTPQERKFLLL